MIAREIADDSSTVSIITCCWFISQNAKLTSHRLWLRLSQLKSAFGGGTDGVEGKVTEFLKLDSLVLFKMEF